MSKNTIELNAIGSKVKLEDDVVGTIIGIHINHNNVSYEIGWWNGRSYSKDHFSTYQFTPTSDEKTRIGFA